jgi:hypothetical protein
MATQQGFVTEDRSCRHFDNRLKGIFENQFPEGNKLVACISPDNTRFENSRRRHTHYSTARALFKMLEKRP